MLPYPWKAGRLGIASSFTKILLNNIEINFLKFNYAWLGMAIKWEFSALLINSAYAKWPIQSLGQTVN